MSQRVSALSALSAAISTLTLLTHTHTYRFLNDDAFISFRYAHNWSRRGEVVYNIGERVEGYTNFLWVALLAAADHLGASIPSAALTLGALTGALALLAALALAQEVTAGAERRAREVALLLPLTGALIALSPTFACWVSGGLEAPLLALLLTAALWRTSVAWGEGARDPERAAWAGAQGGALLALATLTRPEGLMFFGLAALGALSRCARARRLPARAEWSWVGAYLLVFIPYQLWRWGYYGYPFPNTYYVKEGSAALWGPGGRYLLSWLVTEPWLLLSLGGVCWAAVGAGQGAGQGAGPRSIAARLSLAWIAAQCLHVAHVGGDFMALHRFMAPLTPLCALWAAWGCLRALSAARARPLALRLAPLAPLALLALLTPWALHLRAVHARANAVGSAGGVDSIGWLREFVGQCEGVGRWIAHNTPPSARLATTAAGAIAFYSDRYTLDLLGLNDAWVAHHVPARGARPGHTKSAPFDYVMRQRPDLLIYHPTLIPLPNDPNPQHARALAPRGFEWRVVALSGVTPPYWGFWARRALGIPTLTPPHPTPHTPLTPQETP